MRLVSLVRRVSCLSLYLGACGDPSGTDWESPSDETGSDGYASFEGDGGSGAEATSGDDGTTTTGTTTGGEEGGSDEGASTDTGSGDGDGEEEGGDVPPLPGQLTAGEWRDLSHMDFWVGLFADEFEWTSYEDRWNFHLRNQLALVVVDSEDTPVADAEVRLLEDGEVVWRTRTDNHGEAATFAGVFDQGALAGGSYTLEVESAGEMLQQTQLEASVFDPYIFQFSQALTRPDEVDIMMVIDTTSSMGDELSYLQAELGSVIERVQDDAGDLSLRLSMNFYRDSEDDYLVASHPFTTDVSQAMSQLEAESWAGGGDYPEAVVEALEDGVLDHEWSPTARARLLFLVLDAPAHHDQGRVQRLNELALVAAEKGIHIIPLACSGTDKDTEFLVRFLEVSTGGTYAFLTNDSGIGGDHIDPTVGDFAVEYLDDLLVRVIGEMVE